MGKTQTVNLWSISFFKENYDNSRTSDDIDMKPRPVTKLDRRNKATFKKIDHDIIVIFLIYGQFGAIRMLDSKPVAC